MEAWGGTGWLAGWPDLIDLLYWLYNEHTVSGDVEVRGAVTGGATTLALWGYVKGR